MRSGNALKLAAEKTSPERLYCAHASAAHRKTFGQYFTPMTVAQLMADWLSAVQPKRILDPALGTGVLTRAARARLPNARIVAYEKDPTVLSFADVGTSTETSIKQADFMEVPFTEQFDGVIMNPPYVRHREMTGYEAARRAISVRCGHEIPKSANLYVYFTIKAALHLREGGRAAVLIPSEWMNANFSTSLKAFLLENLLLREIVLFSGCSTVFEDALTTASILMLEKSA